MSIFLGSLIPILNYGVSGGASITTALLTEDSIDILAEDGDYIEVEF